MILYKWAAKHQVPPKAVAELVGLLTALDYDPPQLPGESEAAIQTRIRLELSRKGGRFWRNNVGACYTVEGSFLRYGLANDTKQLNTVLKSSDLIGIQPVKITPEHVGRTLGQFVAREVKAGGWTFSGTPREQAQLKFIELVTALGGNAAFAAGEGTL